MCRESVIDCPTDANCYIYCTGSSSSCREATINCPINGHCVIECGDGINSCLRVAEIHGPIGYNLSLVCSGTQACEYTEIYAVDVAYFNFVVKKAKSGESKTANSGLFYFPPKDGDTPRAYIIAQDEWFNGIDRNAQRFYAINGWKDVSIFYNSTDYSRHAGIMYCNIGYIDSCPFDENGWRCDPNNTICDDPILIPTNKPSPIPTIPSQSPSLDPTNDPNSFPSVSPLSPSLAPLVSSQMPYISTSLHSSIPTYSPSSIPNNGDDHVREYNQTLDIADSTPKLEDTFTEPILIVALVACSIIVCVLLICIWRKSRNNKNEIQPNHENAIRKTLATTEGMNGTDGNTTEITSIITTGSASTGDNDGSAGDTVKDNANDEHKEQHIDDLSKEESYHSSYSDPIYPYKYAVQKQTSYYGLKDDIHVEQENQTIGAKHNGQDKSRDLEKMESRAKEEMNGNTNEQSAKVTPMGNDHEEKEKDVAKMESRSAKELCSGDSYKDEEKMDEIMNTAEEGENASARDVKKQSSVNDDGVIHVTRYASVAL